MSFNADDNLFFDAGDLSMSVTTIDLTATDVRFETADSSRTAIQDWNIENDMDFQVTESFLGLSAVNIASDNDLNLNCF